MKKKILFTTLALGAVALGVGSGVILLEQKDIVQTHASDVVEVGDVATFKSVFDGSAAYYNRNIKLTADIDYGGGDAVGLRMAGSFSGTLDGNGHTISNIKLNQAFFNLVTGTVKDLTFNCTSTGSGFGGLAYAADTGSTFTNVTVNATFGAALNNWGPIAFWSKGTISDCKAYITIPTAYAAANTLFHMARADSGSVFTNDLYKVTGTGSFLADPTGVSEMTTVSAATVADVSVAATSTATATATLTGNDYDHIKWVVGNTSIATVASTTTKTNSVAINGLVVGSTTLTATVYADAAEATSLAETNATITVTNGSPVSAISLSGTASIAEGLTENITGSLTGNLYDHIDWSSSSTANATIAGNGLSATLTAVARGSVTITAKVYDSASALLATGTLDITITAPSGFTIYFLDQQADNTTHNSASVFVYNPGDIDNAAATRVTDNGANVRFRMADPADSAVKNWIVWSYFVNITAHPSVTTGSYVQLSYNGVGRWGAGMNLGTITQDIFCVSPAVGSAAPTKLGSAWTSENFRAVMTYAAGTIYGSSWRDADNSICYKKNNQTTLKTLIDGYDALSTDVKAITDSLNDSTTSYTATYGETMVVLKSLYTSGNQANTIFSSDNKDNTALIAAIAGFSVVAVAAGTFILLRKKHE